MQPILRENMTEAVPSIISSTVDMSIYYSLNIHLYQMCLFFINLMLILVPS